MHFLRTGAAGAVIGLAILMAAVSPASAHDSLIDSSPTAEERLASSPEVVELSYSGQLLVLGTSSEGATVLVVDESGTDWVAEPVIVDGNRVTATLKDELPDAGYQIRWQVISEDGHPISGIVPFTVGDGEPFVTATDKAGSSPGDATGQNDQSDSQPQAGSRIIWVAIAGAVIAAAGYFLIHFIRRRRSGDRGGESSLPEEHL